MANYHSALDPVFHALADSTRRAIIQRLGRGHATVSELARPFDMALPSFMKHLDVLERSHLIVSSKTGRVRTCELERANLLAAQDWFDQQRELWRKRYDNLDVLLNNITGEDSD